MTRYTALLVCSILLGFSFQLSAQVNFTIDIQPISINNAPGVQSYSWGTTSDGKWVILGGRIDGLHQRQPFAAFLEQDNNKSVFVIDPVGNQTWSANLDVLPATLFEQIQSTNQNFTQVGGKLYIAGGYGRSNTVDDHITFDGLIAVDLDGLADAVINGNPVASYFRVINDPVFKITGGQMDYLDSVFYLVGGHLFDGRYNPMGPNNGPGFVQEYSNEIRTFKILDDGTNLNFYDYNAIHDTVNLHRRDYNLAPQIYPDGSYGFTAFSGVFDYNNMPYLNVVEITSGSYTVNNTFNQLLSQYHSAKMPIYDTVGNVMHTFFFGGLSQFNLDAQGTLVEDVDVPFVKTVSRVSRMGDGSMIETKLDYIEMPALMGPGSEFIPLPEYQYSNHVLNLSSVPAQRTLVGYIYGGIESTGENIFFVNDGTQSSATTTIFEVYIDQTQADLEETTINGKNVFNLKLYPNPVGKKLKLTFYASSLDTIDLGIVSMDGKIIRQEEFTPWMTGEQEYKLDVSDLSEGSYFLTITNGAFQFQEPFVKR